MQWSLLQVAFLVCVCAAVERAADDVRFKQRTLIRHAQQTKSSQAEALPTSAGSDESVDADSTAGDKQLPLGQQYLMIPLPPGMSVSQVSNIIPVQMTMETGNHSAAVSVSRKADNSLGQLQAAVVETPNSVIARPVAVQGQSASTQLPAAPTGTTTPVRVAVAPVEVQGQSASTQLPAAPTGTATPVRVAVPPVAVQGQSASPQLPAAPTGTATTVRVAVPGQPTAEVPASSSLPAAVSRTSMVAPLAAGNDHLQGVATQLTLASRCLHVLLLCIVLAIVFMLARGIQLKDLLEWSERRLPSAFVGWSKGLMRQTCAENADKNIAAGPAEPRGMYRKSVLASVTSRSQEEQGVAAQGSSDGKEVDPAQGGCQG
eukprot:TRINITY_DN14167_c0_g1_i3.p1 TRINITY_DN14167_c0_g1~~TRINITY_DN14167_c0_g1_i3.p1  ORF type:complete len:394 (-),score=56.50 TRINITY_DN14167_c0_g1_i3:99-1220(-)